MSSKVDILKRALELRAPVLRDTDAFRWLDADVEPYGVTIERYGAFAVFNAYTDVAATSKDEWALALIRAGVEGVYYKHRVRDDLRRVERGRVAPSEPIAGETAPASLTVSEHGLVFEVRLGDGFSTGLFLDQRDNRQRLRQQAQGKRVLNLFCYTGSFSVATGVGGAVQVTSVDLSAAVLRRVDDNLRLNGLHKEQHRLLRADCVAWVQRAVRRGDQYDLVVLDPPSFGSDGAKTWAVSRDYFQLASQVMTLGAPGATLLCVTNHRGIDGEAFADGVREAASAAKRGVVSLVLPPPPLDCGLQGGSQGATKSAMVKLQ